MNKEVNYNGMVREEQPSYKLLNKGASSCTSVDLLSLIISRGAADAASQLQARQLLNIADGKLLKLATKRPEELEIVPGIGRAKAMAVLAALQLGRMACTEDAQTTQLNMALSIHKLMKGDLIGLDHEEAWVVLLNQNFRLIKKVRISVGGISETAVDVRQIMKEAVLANATVFTLIHNHPSNNVRPSSEDDRITDKVSKAAETMRLYFLDHIIFANNDYYSYRDAGKL